MSGENADLAREAHRAGSERDIERALPLLDENVVLDASARRALEA